MRPISLIRSERNRWSLHGVSPGFTLNLETPDVASSRTAGSRNHAMWAQVEVVPRDSFPAQGLLEGTSVQPAGRRAPAS